MYPRNNLCVVVPPVGKHDPNILRDLITVAEIFLARQQALINTVIQHSVNLVCVHSANLLVREAAHIDTECVKNPSKNLPSHPQVLTVKPRTPQKLRQNLPAFIMPNVSVIARKIPKQYIALVCTLPLEVVPKVLLKAFAVKTHTLAFLRRSVIVYQKAFKCRCQNLIAYDVIDDFIGHGVVGYVPCLPAFT